jgi:glycosyltransferase involved in cell wall biosynthesis
LRPHVSIIIPTYFEEKYIESCLKSIRKQKTSKKIEIIVVDSNSLDRTRKIAKRYADKLINIGERGVGKARNIGAKVASGNILIFVDADTVLHENFVETLTKKLENKRTVCCSGYISYKDENLNPFVNICVYFWFRLNYLISLISCKIGFPLLPSVCIGCKKWAFDKIGGFNENLIVGEDIDFSLRMRKAGNCCICKESLAWSSVRRVKKYGMIKNLYHYLKNYLKIWLFGEKPSFKDFPHVSE